MTSPADKIKSCKLPYPVWEFNYKPERYVHSSWLSDLPNAQLLQKLINEDSSQKATRLSHHLMSQLGFNGKFYFDFSDPFTKLALWHGNDIQKLVYYVGVLFYFDEIRQQITKAQVREYRVALGEELYNFALNVAPTIKNKQLKTINLPDHMPIKQRVLIAGILSLFTAMKGYPVALIKRLVVKLPRKWFDCYAHYAAQYSEVPGGSSGNIAIIAAMMNEINKNNNNDDS